MFALYRKRRVAALVPQVQSIFGDILKAIAHCHAAHVCHRDLKFKNMMIDANSRVTMVDFGLAVQVAPGQELHDSCGTVPFAAPEAAVSLRLSFCMFRTERSKCRSCCAARPKATTAQLRIPGAPTDSEQQIKPPKPIRSSTHLGKGPPQL